jgi:NifB/MoaA-like Fe-S oxidoreductase
LGARFVFAGDEVFALASVEFPAAEDYEDFPQRDNGVGLARLFLDELAGTDFRRAAGLSVTLVTGFCARGPVEAMARRMREHGVCAAVAAVPNRLLGESITVAGLLAGADIAEALSVRATGDIIALPAAALRDGEFLDSIAVKELSRRLGKKVISAAGPRELARKLGAARRPVRAQHAVPLRARTGAGVGADKAGRSAKRPDCTAHAHHSGRETRRPAQ